MGRNVPVQSVRAPDRPRQHALSGWGSDRPQGLAEGCHDPVDDLDVDLEGQHHQHRRERGSEAAAGVAAGVLEVEPDREGAGEEHGEDGPAAAAAQDPGEDGGELGDDERAVQQQRPQPRQALAVEAGVAGVGVQGAVAGRERDRGDPEGEGGDHEDDGPAEGVEVRKAQAHRSLLVEVEARVGERDIASALGVVVDGGWLG